MRSKTAVGSECLRQLKELIATEYVPDSATHDLTHLARVASLGQQICKAEGGDRLIVTSAAWLHDLHRDARKSSSDFFVPPEDTDDRVRSYLAKAGFPDGLHDQILEAIHYTDRFSFSDRPVYDTSTEAKIVRDADCLDAIGAIGIARSFTFGGAHGIAIWEESSFEAPGTYVQSERPASTIQHFHDKLLRLSDEMETSTGKKLAQQRTAYMENFVSQFMNEWREDMSSLPA